MNPILKGDTQLKDAPSSLRARVKHYNELAIEVESFLSKNPNEWGRFQSRFNWEINGVFREIMNFEKECVDDGKEEKIFKLKKLFVNKMRKYFLHGDFINWSLQKPYGYAGDFKIIDDIYQNNPTTIGFDRLFDNYFQMSAISVAVRNRKEDFKRIISGFVSKHKSSEMRIMDIASGPCRDIKELLFNSENGLFRNVSFDCFDADSRSIKHAKGLLENSKQVNFTEINVLRIALKKEIEREFAHHYDIIFSTGLFDYLDARISTRLISNLKRVLKPNGILAISDVRDKFSNPSIYFMEWVADWSLIYREDDDFHQLFIDSGFHKDELKNSYEQQGIMQYIIAEKKS